MGMLAAVQGAVAPGAEDRICMRLRARMGELSASSWSIGPGRALAAALICAVAILMLADPADAAKRRGGSRHAAPSAPPALDAQAVNAAQVVVRQAGILAAQSRTNASNPREMLFGDVLGRVIRRTVERVVVPDKQHRAQPRFVSPLCEYTSVVVE